MIKASAGVSGAACLPDNGRNTDGTFGPGNPGKPKGTRHKATRAALALLYGEAEALKRQSLDNGAAPMS